MLQALIGPATKLLGKFIEDKDVKNKLAREICNDVRKTCSGTCKRSIRNK